MLFKQTCSRHFLIIYRNVTFTFSLFATTGSSSIQSFVVWNLRHKRRRHYRHLSKNSVSLHSTQTGPDVVGTKDYSFERSVEGREAKGTFFITENNGFFQMMFRLSLKDFGFNFVNNKTNDKVKDWRPALVMLKVRLRSIFESSHQQVACQP